MKKEGARLHFDRRNQRRTDSADVEPSPTGGYLAGYRLGYADALRDAQRAVAAMNPPEIG